MTMKRCPVHGPINHWNAASLTVCPIDGVEILTDENNGVQYVSPEDIAKQFVTAELPGPASWGPGKWNELHTQVDTEPKFDVWYASIPCTACRDEVDLFTASNAFDPDPWWGFDLHNHVNTNLSKPLMTEAEAQALYGWGDRDVGAIE